MMMIVTIVTSLDIKMRIFPPISHLSSNFITINRCFQEKFPQLPMHKYYYVLLLSSLDVFAFNFSLVRLHPSMQQNRSSAERLYKELLPASETLLSQWVDRLERAFY